MIYFDNAATTYPKPESVYDFTDKFYREYGVNVGRGQHRQASIASNLVDDTRKRLLSLFHAPNKKVAFTHSATEALNVILQGVEMQDKFNVYVSPFEHNAVMRVLHYIKSKVDINIIELSVAQDNLLYDIERIKHQFFENTPHVVAISHASNVCGLIAPIEDICTLAKGYNAITVIDMAQTAGLVDTNLSSEIYDFAVFAGHKTLYSPFGVAGFLCGNTKLKPLIYGGTGIDSASDSMPITIPEMYEPGSPNIAAIAGLNASLQWIETIGVDILYKRECENHSKLIKTLSNFPNITIIGLGKNFYTGIVSCIFDSYSCDNIGQVLNEHNIAVRTGLHCAPNAHKFLGTYPVGTVRFSTSYFNTDEDFLMLEEALRYIEENSY